MTAFKPKREDGRPLWAVIYAEVCRQLDNGELDIGGVIKHETLRALLSADEQPQYYSAVASAIKRLQTGRQRSLMSQKPVGYRVVAGIGQIAHAQHYHSKARRNMVSALHTAHFTDRAIMEPDDRRWADRIEMGLVNAMTVAAMALEKTAQHDSVLKELKSQQYTSNLRQTATQDELADLQRQVDELKKKGGKE